MQRIHLFILFLLTSSYGFSQFNIDHSQVFGGNSIDEAIEIAVNANNTFLFFGSRTFSTDGDVPGNNGGSDFWVMKRNINGTLIWSKTYGGFNNDDLVSIMPHPDGGMYVFGSTRNEQGPFGDLLGLSGGWLIRTDATGDLTNGKIFGGDISENAIEAIRHPSGNITMALEAGSLELNGQKNHGIFDVWIVQVNAFFTTQWSTLLGGSQQDRPTALATDINGNIYFAASSQSNLAGLSPNAGGLDVWVVKLDPNGNMLWQTNFGGTAADTPTDIVFDPDGHLYVVIQSESSDGDFGSNYGMKDLWLLKLEANGGNTVFLSHLGGEGNDANANIDRFGEDDLVISATSSSDTFDLSGNKGFNDVWVLTTDLNGNLKNQMNYGGSLNDQAGDLLSLDSVFYLLNSSLSSDINVPANTTSQQDLWYLILNADSDSCSNQFICLQDSAVSNELFPPSTNELVCVDGCTAGLGPGPSFIQGGCQRFDNPTAYYKLTTDAAADLVTLSVFSDEFNEPQLAILKSNGCISFTKVACTIGADGFALLQYVVVDPLSYYIIAVSDAGGNVGNFEFCVTSIDVEFCNEKDSLYINHTSMGSPFGGPFQPGELVQVCYELTDWNKIDCNGFQGVVPAFGPGWDPDGFDIFGMPLQIDSVLMPVALNGFWDWYQQGDVRYNINNPIAGYQGGQGMPPGWYFTNLSHPPPNEGPDQTTGDIDNCLPTPDNWKVCFTLPVEDECTEHLDASISMRTFSDGEIGANISLACAYDRAETLTLEMTCCLNPGLQFIHEISVCSGDTISFVPETNIIPPVSFSWLADPDVGIEGASSQSNFSRFYQVLTNETNGILKVNYMLTAQGYACETDPIVFTIQVIPLPTSRITLTGPSTICSGSTVTLNFENTGTQPFAIELWRDNQFFANVLAESTSITIQIDPVFTSRLRVGKVKDAFCDGAGLGFVNVTVKPVGSAVIDTSVCEGEAITIANEIYTEPGLYTITLADAAANDCDSVISLTLGIIPSLTDIIDEEVCGGDTIFVLGIPYTETTHQLIEYIGPSGCPDFIQLDLIVTDTFIDEINQTICAGDTIIFEGAALFQAGTYSHVDEVQPGCFNQIILNLTVLSPIVINDFSIIKDIGTNTGAVLVEIVGGSPPFTYLWSSGQVTESIFNVMHGEYSLTVTDSRGCVEVFHFTVPLSTSVEEQFSNEDIQIFPTIVPAGQKRQISVTAAFSIHIQSASWYSMNGLFLADIEISGIKSGYTIDVPPTIPSGVYFLRLTTSSGSLWQKIVVQ